MLDATKCFRVSAIRLSSTSFQSTEDVSEVVIDLDQCTGQTRRWTSHKIVDRTDEDDSTRYLLATVSLGFRLVKNDEADEEPGKVYYTIEASFIAEFEIRSTDFDDAALNDFVNHNATHVVWPFWRQHVYATLQAASLPAISIPLMAAVNKRAPEQLSAVTDASV